MSLRSELLNDNEDPIITSLKKLTSIPFQDVVDNSLKQSDSSADSQLVNRLTYIKKDDFTPIKNAIEPLELKKLHNKELTAREYFVLGNFYDFFLEDYENAASCYEKAEEKGDTGVLNHLGLMYLDGKGVQKNLIKAKQYLEKAAEKGVKLAQLNLFHYYSDIKDNSTAEIWIKKSLVTNDHSVCTISHFWYADYLETKNDIPSKIEVRRHYQIAAENGHISALVSLARIYATNIELDPNLNRSKQYWEFLIPYSPSIKTLPEVQLGNMYFHGLANIEKNYRLAADYYEKLIASDYCEKLSQQNKSSIYRNIATIYETGSEDFKRDLNKAARYYFKFYESKEGMSKKDYVNKLYCLHESTYNQEYDNFTEVRYYLELVRCYYKGMFVNNYTTLIMGKIVNKLIDECKLHQLDALIEENLKYMQTSLDVEKNEFHRQFMARIIKNLEERDDTIGRLINQDPASIVSHYVLGEEGHKTKLHYQSFFANPKNNIDTIKEATTSLPDCSKLSL